MNRIHPTDGQRRGLSLCYLLPSLTKALLLAMAPHIHSDLSGSHNFDSPALALQLWKVTTRRISFLLPNLSAFEVWFYLVPSSMLSVSHQLRCDCGIRVSRFDFQGYNSDSRCSITSLAFLGITQTLRI